MLPLALYAISSRLKVVCMHARHPLPHQSHRESSTVSMRQTERRVLRSHASIDLAVAGNDPFYLIPHAINAQP